MISLSKVKFHNTQRWLNRLKRINFESLLDVVGGMGVKALSMSTPVDTGETANSWSYRVTGRGETYRISWTNRVMAGAVPLVILIQYGHGTRSGGYVSGRDFINPALKPVFDTFRRMLLSEIEY